MPWASVAPMVSITECTADAQFGACGDDPPLVADDGTMAATAAFLCENWAGGCNSNNAIATGMSEGLAGPMLAPATFSAMLGCSASAPATTTSTPVAAEPEVEDSAAE